MEHTPARILIVDDEPAIVEFISYALHREGYAVETANDGEEALGKIAGQDFDLFILDIMMPGIDGYELCGRIRSQLSAPIMFLSAKDSELNKVVGLEMGADDYLAKPFGVRELIARVHALLRRPRAMTQRNNSHLVTVQGITLDEAAHSIQGDKGPIDLTPREFELMSFLMRNAGTVVSREELLKGAWGWEYVTGTKTVDTHIKRLRSKIERAGYDPKLVETVRGYGYRISE